MHKSTGTHHRHCTTTVVTGESFASKAGLALIEMGGKKKSLGQLFMSLGTIRRAKKQIAADNLIIRSWAWALHYLTEIGLSHEASGLIEQERWGR